MSFSNCQFFIMLEYKESKFKIAFLKVDEYGVRAKNFCEFRFQAFVYS
jgi:hypothetical protein